MDVSVLKHIKQHNLISNGDKIMVGVSGGPDSIALLHWLHKNSSIWDISIMAVHVNHNFRGPESDGDQEYVEDMCQQWGIRCISNKIDVPSYMKEKGLSKQVAARESRYTYFNEVAREYKMNKLALAHHGDDQTETIMMRFIRGAGLSGLSGMPVLREEQEFVLIRPFLSLSKAIIEEYCREHQINPRLDSSNLSDDYTRNEIRHKLLPYLKQANPNIHQVVYDMSNILRLEDQYLQEIVQDYFQEILISRDQDKIIVSRDAFVKMALPLQRRIILLILSYLTTGNHSWSKVHIDQIIKIAQEDRGYKLIHLPDRIGVEKEYSKLTFLHKNHIEKVDNTLLWERIPREGELISWNFRVKLNIKIMDKDPNKQDDGNYKCIEDAKEKGIWRAIFDAEKLHYPLFLRNRKPGDNIQPLGMKGHKKVKDIFIDYKVPQSKRAAWPIVMNQDGILWMVGLKRSNIAKVTNETKRIVLIEIEEIGEDFFR